LIDAILHFLDQGLLGLNWWQLIIATLVLTHITIAAVTIYLHRCMAHRGLDLHPIPSHFFRFWLWLTTGMVTKEWVSIHRKHHAKCERDGDPHSPKVFGLKKVLLEGSELYRAESKVDETLTKYGHGCPDDWMENNVYTKRSVLGVTLMMIIDIALFGIAGVAVWGVQMLWIPVTAAGIINGLGHAMGYRNFDIVDASTNVSPWGILIGGEELHNNHHSYPTSAKLSSKWYEFDIGWMYIRILSMLGLATIRKVAPKPKLAAEKLAKQQPDAETLQAVIALRYEVMAQYGRAIKKACREEASRLKASSSPNFHLFESARDWMHLDSSKWTGEQQQTASTLCEESERMKLLVQMRSELASIWDRSNHSGEQLVKRLQQWCERAEASGIRALEDMSLLMKRFQPV